MRLSCEAEGHDAAAKAIAGFFDQFQHRGGEKLYRAVGLAGLTVPQREVAGGGKRSGGYKPLSWVTRVLRVKGKRGKYRNMADIMGSPHRPLQNTGVLRNSWTIGKTPGAVDAWPTHSIAGTSLKYAELHQTGGMSDSFVFVKGSENWGRFAANMLMVLPGAAPASTRKSKSGKKRKNWNKDYFILRARLMKMHGKRYKVTARQQIPANFPNNDDWKKFERAIGAEIDEMLKASGFDGGSL